MTARLSRLRIAGFKSFAEPVSLDILPGLTGIVGPNGCGKSNVVEALRWAMGETSAKSLRGGEMDDVIFAGTTARASRNLAEVTITLVGEERGDLPAPFEAEAELQVTRRIERGAGSQFRVNGREQRARDVQTLYADLASGARSSGMVSQGRVSQLVNAKPEERRQVLEEAAGITGLHARRHEAELKLRAAEQNLARAEDLRVQLEGARDGMRKQARQAARYKNISGLIRAAETEHLAVMMAAAKAQLAACEQALATAREAARQATAEVETSSEALDEAEAALPAPREALSAAERTLERRRIEAEGLTAEAERVTQEAAASERLLLELQADLEAAARSRADSGASVERLQEEAERLARRETELPTQIEAVREAVQVANAAAETAREVAAREAETAHQAAIALAEARTADQAARARWQAAEARHFQAVADRQNAEASLVSPERLSQAEAAVLQAEEDLEAAKAAAEQAELARVQAAQAHADQQATHERAQSQRRLAEQAMRDAAQRAERLRTAMRAASSSMEALLESRVPEAALDTIRAAAESAGHAAETSEHALEAAERAASEAQHAQGEQARRHQDLTAARRLAAQAVAEARARVDRLRAEFTAAEAAVAEARRALPDPARLAEASEAATRAEHALTEATAALEAAQGDRLAADRALSEARDAAHIARADAARLAGEAAGLADALAAIPGESNLLASIEVQDGWEAALGAALGDAADTSLDEAALRFWRELASPPPPPALPPGSRALADFVRAPAALGRLLAHVAVLADEADGDALQTALPPGAVAVRRDGACWRWDGQVVRPGAPNAAALRLVQRRRLARAQDAQNQAEATAEAAALLLAEATNRAACSTSAEQAARTALSGTEAAFRAARDAAQVLEAARAQAEARLSRLLPSMQALQDDLGAADTGLATAQETALSLDDPAHAAAQAEHAASQARAAEASLQAARATRQSARATLAAAQEKWRQAQARASETEARIAASAPALDELATELAQAEQRLLAANETVAQLPQVSELTDKLHTAASQEAGARETEQAARTRRQSAEQAAESARAALATLRRAQAEAESRLAALTSLTERTEPELAEAALAKDRSEKLLGSLADTDKLTQRAAEARAAADEARAAAQAAAAQHSALLQAVEQTQSASRLLADDLAAWQARHAEARDREAALAVRCQVARATWQNLSATPGDISARAARSAAALEAAQSAHAAASAKSHAAEQRARALAVALRDAEQRQSACREALVRAEASREAAGGAVLAVLTRAAERLGEDASLPEVEDHTDAIEEKARRKFERLTREREEMGPVNLRAELELAELDERATNLEREREELGTAIAKLRGAIGHINREGRERLTAVFTQVDQHFRTLFTRMMGGGRAHLALTGSDDPLAAGLEIYAEPPGKKLSSLALLSGGEQALTALSLIFAVFRCTPAPVSVLDEVDAPLDDANVDRFCTLLDDVVRDTGTRFLVVTHHQLTMSRMDRLFGVTMQERGVSRLLSVDFQNAVALVEPALQAAE